MISIAPRALERRTDGYMKMLFSIRLYKFFFIPRLYIDLDRGEMTRNSTYIQVEIYFLFVLLYNLFYFETGLNPLFRT